MRALAKHPRQLAKEPAGTWFGLRFGDRSTHTSRTKIFSELAELLKFVLASAHCDAFGTVIGPAGRRAAGGTRLRSLATKYIRRCGRQHPASRRSGSVFRMEP
jgi:hypothetical protein